VQPDLNPVEEMTLALLHLTTFDEGGTARSWKGHDWDVMNHLHEKGLISNPATKAKSVTLSDDGRRLSRELFEKYFGGSPPSPGRRVPSRTTSGSRRGLCECGCGEPVEGSLFLPGHDQRLRVALETRVGGLVALRGLVEELLSYGRGDSSLEDMGRSVRRALWENGVSGRGDR
jgi:uncharacterized protein DUF6429